MRSVWHKKDKYGQEIRPGDVCVRSNNGSVEFIIYQKPSWGAKGSKGEFGRFISPSGRVTIKYSNTIFVYDPMGKREVSFSLVKELVKRFYE